jgi:hypothetical protein
MKLFRVVVERDGKTVKAPGISETEVQRFEYRYAANSMQEVWDVIEELRRDEEQHLIAIVEDAPLVEVVRAAASIGETPNA